LRGVPVRCEDDGTARDKVTRVEHLGALSLLGQPRNQPKFEVIACIACIAGRGFCVRREDMKKLLLATRGKVFTLKNLGPEVPYFWRISNISIHEHSAAALAFAD